MCSLGWDGKTRGGQVLNRDNVTLSPLPSRNHGPEPSLCLCFLSISKDRPRGAQRFLEPSLYTSHFWGPACPLPRLHLGEGVLGQPGPLGGGAEKVAVNALVSLHIRLQILLLLSKVSWAHGGRF